MKRPCHFCGRESDRHRWDFTSDQWECWQGTECDRRRAERADEAERLGNEGAVA
jgi:hypothetical protein